MITAALHIRVHNRRVDSVLCRGVGVMLPQKCAEVIIVFRQNCGQRKRVDEFEEALVRTSGQNFVRSQLQVQVFLSEQALHQLEELDDQLVLADVITVLEEHRVIEVGGCLERQQQRLFRTLEDVCGFCQQSN